MERSASDRNRIRDILYSEMEVTSIPVKCMALFSPGCELLLRWCHALGDACGCPPPTPLAEERLRSARAEAEEARDQRKKAREEARAAKEAARADRDVAKKDTEKEGWESEASEESGGRLQLKSLISGEVFATLPGALPTWTYKDIVDRLRPLLPQEAGVLTLLVGEALAPMERYEATLESLGLDFQECELFYRADTVEAFVEFYSDAKGERKKPSDMEQAEHEAEIRVFLAGAEEELSVLNQKDLMLIKALARPPMHVHLTVEAVAIILQQPVTDWRSLAAVLADSCLEKMRLCTQRSVPLSTLARLEWYVNHDRLSPEFLRKGGCCASALMQWVRFVFHAGLLKARLGITRADA